MKNFAKTFQSRIYGQVLVFINGDASYKYISVCYNDESGNILSVEVDYDDISVLHDSFDEFSVEACEKIIFEFSMRDDLLTH